MALQFDKPWLLLLMLPAAAFLYYTAKNMIKMASWKKTTILSLRSMVFFIIILLLSGFSISRTADTATTLFLMDSSDSVTQKEQGEDFIREAIKHMKRNDRTGVINFGETPAIEILPGKTPSFSDIQTKINPSFTNIENALVTAQSIMPWDHRKRVVVITDGRENIGNALTQARQMKSKGYIIDVYPVSSEAGEEVQLENLAIPESVHLNEQFEIVVDIKSNVNTPAVLQLYSDRLLTGQKQVMLNKGDNQFVFDSKAVKGGMVTYRVEVFADADTLLQNNTLSSYTYVKDIPKVLVVEERGKASGVLASMLEDDMELTVVNSKQVPVELPELLKYDAFILVNVSAGSLSDDFLDNLETAVSHQGKGLLVTGGDNSYGPGGYYNTTLEKILPVNMDIKPKEEDPNLALVLVIDKSGSMSGGDFGISKMELAVEAAVRATEVLDEDDMIGVIAFDSGYKWVVEPQKIDNLKAIQDAIGTIRAGGGTQILPSLDAAYNAIKELDASLKHIILLTDGQAEKAGYEPVIEGLRENGITLSTVAVGRGADLLLMQALAYGGGGRYYETDEFTDIPKIFAKEVFLAGKKYLVNRTFAPRLAGYSEILKGIEAVPLLDGYVATMPKAAANIIFASDEDDPVLAAWQYGLGRTAAWTPDVQGIWTYDWMSWEESPKFWKNIMSWIIQQDMGKGYTVETGTRGQDGFITVKAGEDAFMTASEVKGTLVDPEGNKKEIILLPGAPGEYKGYFGNLKSGVYIADITLYGSDGRSERISTGLIMPYSPEYNVLSGDNEVLLEKIAYEGGGLILDNPAQVFDGELPPVEGKTDPAPMLYILLLILLMLDIVMRRLNLRPGIVVEKLESATAWGKLVVGKMLARKPGIPASNSEIPAGASGVSTGTSEVLTSTSKVLKGTSKISTGTSEVLTSTSKVLRGSSKVLRDTSKVSASTSKVSTAAPEVLAGASQEAAREVLQDVPREVLAGASQKVSQDVPQEVPQEVSQRTPREVPRHAQRRTPREAPQHLPRGVPLDVLQDEKKDTGSHISRLLEKKKKWKR